MQALTILKKFFSVDMVIYAAIVIVAATALLRCTLPLSRVAAKLRRAARTIVTESKQNKEKKQFSYKKFADYKFLCTFAVVIITKNNDESCICILVVALLKISKVVSRLAVWILQGDKTRKACRSYDRSFFFS